MTRRFLLFNYAAVILGLGGLWQLPAVAQNDHAHASGADASALVKIVRENTERFKDVAAAEPEGYPLQFGSDRGPDAGEMGLRYMNFPLRADGTIARPKPEIVLYEPLP